MNCDCKICFAKQKPPFEAVVGDTGIGCYVLNLHLCLYSFCVRYQPIWVKYSVLQKDLQQITTIIDRWSCKRGKKEESFWRNTKYTIVTFHVSTQGHFGRS